MPEEKMDKITKSASLCLWVLSIRYAVRNREEKNKTYLYMYINIKIRASIILLYIHVTVRRYRFFFNNQPDALIIQIYSVIKLNMFRATSLPIIRSFFLLYIRHW